MHAASRDDITSPTFTLIHEFRGPEVTLYHVDLYRIETERELQTLGLDELFAEPGNLVLLEWGEKFPRFQRERDARSRSTDGGAGEKDRRDSPKLSDYGIP